MRYQIAWDERIGRTIQHNIIKDGRKAREYDKIECAKKNLAAYLIRRKISRGTILGIRENDPDRLKVMGRIEVTEHGVIYRTRSGNVKVM